ncbi:MAG TPA: methyltransferase domain-containing protein [Pseudonocardiaceae bacterium]|jgi:ubiquinone/menaquinone biosynthesis C-methylase UbiE|nr:methyltransferase domain-containing protein [Pseudonocardiaceae bacterium]
MMLRDPEPDMLRYYAEVFAERDRLTVSASGRLEFLRTQELLRRHLPAPPARVLDVGGGPGAHARWLAAEGFSVHLIDPVASHVAQSTALAPTIRATVGDARDLPVPDGAADAVLLLGPLYHLTNRTDRITALRNAMRAVRPGGPVFAAAISRHASLLDHTIRGRLNEQTWPKIRRTMETGQHDPTMGFTTAYLHLPDELAAELTEAGLSEVDVYGVEGPAWQSLHLEPQDDFDRLLPMVLSCARHVERDPAMLAASQHLLAVGRRPG